MGCQADAATLKRAEHAGKQLTRAWRGLEGNGNGDSAKYRRYSVVFWAQGTKPLYMLQLDGDYLLLSETY